MKYICSKCGTGWSIYAVNVVQDEVYAVNEVQDEVYAVMKLNTRHRLDFPNPHIFATWWCTVNFGSFEKLNWVLVVQCTV